MSSNLPAAYGLGALYPPNLQKNIQAVGSAGWRRIMVSLFHPNQNGDIHFNNTPVFVGGNYVGDPGWAGQLWNLVDPNDGYGITLSASFGGGGVGDFTNIQNIYESNNNSFDGTNLQANVKAMVAELGGVMPIFDMDVEDNYDLPSFVAFCKMFIDLQKWVSFCPYTYTSFWTQALQQLDAYSSGSVTAFNLQMYSGGSGNDPGHWAAAITAAVPGFNTDNFILASASANSTPADVQSAMSAVSGESSVGGAFIWNLDEIMGSSSNGSMADYVAAIRKGLGGS